MIKTATELDQLTVNEYRKKYFTLTELAAIPINERVICAYDDASDDFILGELGHLEDGSPVWVVMCFKASVGNIRPLIRRSAEIARDTGHIDTPVIWLPQKNIVRERAVNLLLQPVERFVRGKKYWECPARKTLARS